MFSGNVLSPSGWMQPKIGMEIAALNRQNRIEWRRITSLASAETELLTLHGKLLSWSASPDCRIAVLGANGRIGSVTAANIMTRHRLSSAQQVKVQHVTQAYPAPRTAGDFSGLMHAFLARHYGTSALPESARALLREVPYRIVYPHLLLQDDIPLNPLAIGIDVALLFVSRIWGWLKPASQSQCIMTLNSPAADFAQAVFFLAGITSIARNNRLTVLLRTRNYSSPVRPVITPRTQITEGHGMAWQIDVPHPVVQFNGSAVVL